MYKICLTFSSFFFFVRHRENPHSHMNIFYLIFSRLLDLDPLPVFLCYEYITRTQKKIILFGGKTHGWMVREERIRMAEEANGIIKQYFS